MYYNIPDFPPDSMRIFSTRSPLDIAKLKLSDGEGVARMIFGSRQRKIRRAFLTGRVLRRK
jgi:hypothetical protein